jgi:hypothetical protein
MTALLTVETILLVLLSVLVAGLLRSHAEILRRLGAKDEPERTEGPASRWAAEGERHPDWLPRPRTDITPAFDIMGRTLAGEAVHIGVQGSPADTLLAFLSSGCATCLQFWRTFREEQPLELPGRARLVIVTKDTGQESPSKLRDLAPRNVPVVMSTQAWDAYKVPLSPYFIFVEAETGEVAGEGSAGNWPQVESLLRDALADAELARHGAEHLRGDNLSSPGNGRAGTVARLARMDSELAAAGIGPGHPSLYAGDEPPKEDGSMPRPSEGEAR